MENNNKKHLFVFDLDHTILSANSDHVIWEPLSNESKKDLNSKMQDSDNWANFMQTVYIKMKEENIPIDTVKSIVENIPFNQGYKELFQLIQSNKHRFDTLIISGANTLFLEWILQKQELVDLFPTYYSNWAEPNEEFVIKIRPHHIHDCSNCDKSQCKRLILLNHFEKNNLKCEDYEKILYAGDGENDYCLATILREGDILFPRANFPLDKKLHKKGFLANLKSEVYVWEDGNRIIEEVKKII